MLQSLLLPDHNSRSSRNVGMTRLFSFPCPLHSLLPAAPQVCTTILFCPPAPPYLQSSPPAAEALFPCTPEAVSQTPRICHAAEAPFSIHSRRLLTLIPPLPLQLRRPGMQTEIVRAMMVSVQCHLAPPPALISYHAPPGHCVRPPSLHSVIMQTSNIGLTTLLHLLPSPLCDSLLRNNPALL